MRRRGTSKTVTINTRVEGEFRIDNGILFCNFCDHSIDWKRKSTVDDHLNSKMHKTKKNLYGNKQRQLQQTLVTSLLLNQKKL
jgi:hypothetical protein